MPQLAVLLAESAALIARSAELCTYRRRIAGGSDSDAPAIMEVLAKNAMCLECLVKKTGVPAAEAKAALRRSSYFVAITVDAARCDACLQTQAVYRLSDHTVPPGTGGSTTKAAALWRFLNEQRGRLFCSHCLGIAVGTSKRLDRALFEAEGRGARRQHGPCTACGKDRLVCGLLR